MTFTSHVLVWLVIPLIPLIAWSLISVYLVGYLWEESREVHRRLDAIESRLQP